MATTAVATFSIRLDDGKLTYAPDLSGGLPITVGQICTWDATLNGGNGGIRPATVQADMGALFAGIADQNSILNSLVEQLPYVRVGFKNVYMLHTTAAEVYKMGTKVFFNETVAGSQTVTSGTNAGARTVPVGYVILPNANLMSGVATSLTVTGAAGLDIPVAILATYPVVSIG